MEYQLLGILEELSFIDEQELELDERLKYGKVGVSGLLNIWFGTPSDPSDVAGIIAEWFWTRNLLTLHSVVSADEMDSLLDWANDDLPEDAFLFDVIERIGEPSLRLGLSVACYAAEDGRWVSMDFFDQQQLRADGLTFNMDPTDRQRWLLRSIHTPTRDPEEGLRLTPTGWNVLDAERERRRPIQEARRSKMWIYDGPVDDPEKEAIRQQLLRMAEADPSQRINPRIKRPATPSSTDDPTRA